MFNVSFYLLKPYCHASFKSPQKKPSSICLNGFLFLVKPMRTPRKFGSTLLFCCIWAISSRPMSSWFRGHFSSTNIFHMVLPSMISVRLKLDKKTVNVLLLDVTFSWKCFLPKWQCGLLPDSDFLGRILILTAS